MSHLCGLLTTLVVAQANTPAAASNLHLPVSYWLGFAALVLILLATDLFVFHRQSRETTLREAALHTAGWALMAMGFGAWVWYRFGQRPALQFLNGYLTEWSLSMDNVFVFAVIFSFFRVPRKYQYRVLFWGILGAVVMRLAFVLLGTAVLSRADWVIYLLGLFLIYSGIKLAFHDSDVDPEQSFILKAARRTFRIATEPHGKEFFVRERGKFSITPLFLVLLVVEATDVAFAFDSVPAIFGITQDPFIVYTSNIFAILGLRALYFLLAGVMDLFRYLKYGLSAILVFIGLKMVLKILYDPPVWFINYIWNPPPWARHWLGHPPDWVPLVVNVSLLGLSILASLIASRRDGPGPSASAIGDAPSPTAPKASTPVIDLPESDRIEDKEW